MANIIEVERLNGLIEQNWHKIAKLRFSIDKNLNENVSFINSEEYKNLKEEKEKLQEKLLTLKAERYSLFHEYSFTLNGNIINIYSRIIPNQFMNENIACMIDCNLGNSRALDLQIPSHVALFKLIQDKYSAYFHNGEFRITGIFQHR